MIKPLLLAALLFAAAAPAHAQNPAANLRAVVVNGEAYLPGPVEMVASARAVSVVPHPQGRYALVIKQEAALPPGPATGKADTGGASLLLYDARTHKTKTLWESKADNGTTYATVKQAAWLPQTDCVIALVLNGPTDKDPILLTGNCTLLYVNVAKSLTARALYSRSQQTAFNGIVVSPSKPLALLWSTPTSPERPHERRFLNAKGVLGPPHMSNFAGSVGGWYQDGLVYVESELIPATEPNTGPKTRWYEINAETGAETTLPARPAKRTPEPAPAPLPLRLVSSKLTEAARGKNAAPVTLRPLYLEAANTAPDAPNQSAFLAPHADTMYLLPDQSAVLFTADNALYVVPLVRMKAAPFEAAQNEAYKRDVMARAKQISSCVDQLAFDTGLLPPPGGFDAAVAPYVKSVETLLANPATGAPGFTYTYSGPLALSAKDKPKETVLGYLAGPSGRAVIYLSGSILWEDKK